jgi:hypothetical protein
MLYVTLIVMLTPCHGPLLVSWREEGCTGPGNNRASVALIAVVLVLLVLVLMVVLVLV